MLLSVNIPGVFQTVAAACDLELFDMISSQKDGWATAVDIAKPKHWDAVALKRVLNALVALKLLAKVGNDGKGTCSCQTFRFFVSRKY